MLDNDSPPLPQNERHPPQTTSSCRSVSQCPQGNDQRFTRSRPVRVRDRCEGSGWKASQADKDRRWRGG